jgi:KDO2-lipid IV(A) lauroyltransferase
MKPEIPTKLKIIRFFLRITPLGVRRALVIALAKLGYYLSLKHRLITIHNLTRAFPKKPMDEIIEIAKAAYANFACIIAEFPEITYLNSTNIDRWVKVKGLEHYEKARRKGKGVLLITAHFGNWEFGNAALAILSKPPVFMARRLDSDFLEEASIAARSMLGIRTINKESAMRPVLRFLKAGEAVKLLIDQNVAVYDGVFVDFFGRPACTTTGVALLALHTGAAVLPIFTSRTPDGRFLTEIGEEIQTVVTGNRDSDVLTNTQNYARAIEDYVRKYPKQWFWVHQRWKTRPCQMPGQRMET